MSTVDRRIVEMEFQNGEFEKNIKTSIKSLEDLKKGLELDKAVEHLDSLDDSVKSMNFDPMKKGIDAIANKFSALEVIGRRVLENLTDKAVNFAEKTLKSLTVDQVKAGFDKYALSTQATQTIQSALPDTDLSTIEEVLDKLNTYTDETSYNFTEMVSTIGKFTANGVKLEEAELAMEGIGNAAGKAGANTAEASRVMYNFAQALATGSVKLIDWKSIENANMATKDFKQTIIDTAMELGTLKKAEAGVGKTTKGTTVDFKTFNSTLSEGWFTSEVLIKTLAKYADTSTEFGKQAFEAARKAFTFQQAMDAVKDAVSTGWMHTFKLIFGNVEEAAEVFTGIADGIIDFTDQFSSARNDLLEGWNELGGRLDLISGVSDLWETFLSIVEAVREAFTDIFPPIQAENLKTITEGFADFAKGAKESLGTLRTLTGYHTVEHAEAIFEDFGETLEKGAKGEAVKLMQQRLIDLGYSLDKFGADGVFGSETEEALKKFKEEYLGTSDAVYDDLTHKKFGEVLTKSGLMQFDETRERVENWVEEMPPALERLQRIFRGFFAVLDIGKQALGFVGNILGHVFSLLAPVGDLILDIAAAIGDALVSFSSWIKETGAFEKAFETIKGALQPIGDLIVRVTDGIRNFFGIGKEAPNEEMFTFSKLWGNITDGIEKLGVGKKFSDTFAKIKRGIKKLLPDFDKFGLSLNLNFGEIIKNTVLKISEWIPTALDKIADAFSAVTSFLGPIITKIVEWFKSLGGSIKEWFASNDIWGKVKTFAENAKNIFGGFGRAIVDLYNTAKTFISDKLSGAFSWFLEKLPIGLEYVKSAFEKVKTWMKPFTDKVKGWIEKIREFFSLGDGETSIFGKTFSTKKAFSIKGLIDKIRETVNSSEFLSNLVNTAKRYWKNIKSFFADVWQWIKDLFTDSDKAKASFNKVKNTLKNGLGKVVTAITDIWNNKIKKKFKNFFKGFDWIGNMFKSLFKSLPSFLLSGGALSIIFLIHNISKTFKKASGLLDSVKGFFDAKKKNVYQPLALSVLEFAGAVALIAGAIYGLAQLDAAQIKQGGIAVGIIVGVLVGIMALSNKLQKTSSGSMQSVGTGMLAVAGAVAVLAVVAYAMSYVPWEQFIDGMGKVAVVMVLIGAFIYILNKTKSANLSLAGLLAAAAAISILAGVAYLLAYFTDDTYYQGALKLAAIMVEFGVFLWAVHDLNLVPISEALGLIVAAEAIKIVAGIAEDLSKAGAVTVEGIEGLAACVVALGGLLLAVAAANQKAKFVDQLGRGFAMAVATACIDKLSDVIVKIGSMGDLEAAKVGIEAVTGCAVALGGLVVAVSTIGQGGGGIGGALKGSLILGLVTAILAAAVAAIAAITIQAANEAAKVMYVIGHNIDRFDEFVSGVDFDNMNTALTFIKDFASTIARAAFGFNKGRASDLSSGMNTMGSTLKRYYNNVSVIDVTELSAGLIAAYQIRQIAKVINGIENADQLSTIVSKVGGAIRLYYDDLAGVTITEDSAPDISGMTAVFTALANAVPEEASLTKIASFAQSGNNDGLTDFAIGLTNIGTAINTYASSMRTVSTNQLSKGEKVLSFMAGLKDQIEDVGFSDIFNFMTNNKTSLQDFANDIGVLGDAIESYAKNVGGIEDFDKLALAQDALSGIAGLKDYLSEEGGLKQIWNGIRDIGTFASDIDVLGTGIANYAEAVSGIDDFSGVTASVGVLSALVEAQGNLDKSGGIAQLISGTKQMGSFSSDLQKLGEGIAGFAIAIGDRDDFTNAIASLGVINQLVEVFNALPETGGAKSIFTGDLSLSNFANDVGTLGSKISEFSKSASDFDFTKMSQVTSFLTRIVNAMARANRIQKTDILTDIGNDLGNFSANLQGVDYTSAEATINQIVTMINDLADLPEFKDTGSSMVTTLISGITEAAPNIDTAFSDPVETAIGAASAIAATAISVGTDLVTAVAKGINQNGSALIKGSLVLTIFKAVSSASSYAKTTSYQIGYNVVTGVASGISGNAQLATHAARNMMLAVRRIAEATVDINSPSKVFEWIGRMTDEGLAIGLTNSIPAVEHAAGQVSTSTIDIIGAAMQQMSSLINDDIDMSPTITPVLDLSDVMRGNRTLGSIFNGQEIAVRSNAMASSINSGDSIAYRNVGNSDVVAAIGALNERMDSMVGSIKNLRLVLDTGATVGGLRDEIDKQLGSLYNLRGRKG